MNGPSTPYWDRLAAEERIIVNTLKALVAKLIAKIKTEPALTAGGVAGAVGAVVTWVTTNQITTLRQAETLGAPIVLAFVIRTFVVPKSTHATVLAQVDKLLKVAEVQAFPGQPTPPAKPDAQGAQA